MLMNLFRIDFIQGKTDAPNYNQVVHSLVDTTKDRAIISLSISADKLQSVSNYSREPKRLTFECFPDAWIQEFIMSGIYEHERYVSHFEVKVYRDSELFYSGIIDTSNLSFDVSTGILKFLCYDKIKLISLFSDLTHFYALSAGYLPSWILGYFVADIRSTIPVSIPYSGSPARPDLVIPSGNPITIADIDYSDMMLAPYFPSDPAQLHSSSFPSPFFGYLVDAIQATVTFVFLHKVVWTRRISSQEVWYKGMFRARIYRFFNGICPQISQYDEDTGWKYRLDDLADYHEEMLQFFLDNGIDPAAVFSLPSVAQSDARSYGTSHYLNYWVRATCAGNMIPSKLHLGDAYLNLDNSLTENLSALRAMLMLYNATLYTLPNGTILLKSKDDNSARLVEIDRRDVVSYSIKRGTHETPDMKMLDILAGDSSLLKDLVKQHLLTFHGSRWACDVTIDNINKYNLSLQERVIIDGKTHVITDLERDYTKDEYKIKGWQI